MRIFPVDKRSDFQCWYLSFLYKLLPSTVSWRILMPFGSLKLKCFSYQMLFSFIICWEWMVLLEHSAAKEKEHIRLSLCPPRQRLFFMLRRKWKWRCKTINTGAVRLISPPAQIHDTPFNGFLGKMRQKKEIM